jgi:hypothetical protein
MGVDIGPDDISFELESEIEDVVGDAELLANPARVLDIAH